jgi:hypothetical protein
MKQLKLDDDPSKNKYTQFDESGMPTHGSDGELLNKSQSKRAAKEFAVQQKKYDKYMKQQQ